MPHNKENFRNNCEVILLRKLSLRSADYSVHFKTYTSDVSMLLIYSSKHNIFADCYDHSFIKNTGQKTSYMTKKNITMENGMIDKFTISSLWQTIPFSSKPKWLRILSWFRLFMQYLSSDCQVTAIAPGEIYTTATVLKGMTRKGTVSKQERCKNGKI